MLRNAIEMVFIYILTQRYVAFSLIKSQIGINSVNADLNR